MNKKVIFSGVQASGELTLGNYLGAVKNWTQMQEDYFCLFCVADLHSITVRQQPSALLKRSLDMLRLFIACGIDADKNILFFQSHVPAHAELSWILCCSSYMGELMRMTQFKDKSSKSADNDSIGVGLFTYPVLMAADILLYQTDLVPVGKDQKQHLELARNLALRFNGIYGDVFRLPEHFTPKQCEKIMSLQDPVVKMSKSDKNPKSYILLLDEPDDIVKKIKSAVTDSKSSVDFDDLGGGVSNLVNIYCGVSGESFDSAKNTFSGMGYGKFKQMVAEAVTSATDPIRKKFAELSADDEFIKEIYTGGAHKAAQIAESTLNKVRDCVGFVPVI